VFLAKVLFPFSYWEQNDLRYDPARDVYCVRGLEISGSVIEIWKNNDVGEFFEVVGEHNGVVLIRRCTDATFSTN
jgi:hypothetical protein